MVNDYNKILNNDGLPHYGCIANHYKISLLCYDDTWKFFLSKMPEIKENIENGILIKFNDDIETYTKNKDIKIFSRILESVTFTTFIAIGTRSMIYYGHETEISIISTKINLKNYVNLIAESEELYFQNTKELNRYTNWFGKVAEYYKKRYQGGEARG